MAALSACSTTPAASPTPDNKALYSAAIERYYDAYIHADVDELLDSLDKTSPAYPDDNTIEELRTTAADNVLAGTTTVTALNIDYEAAAAATVTASVTLQVDVAKDGNFIEQSGDITVELRLNEGVWRIYNMAAATTTVQ